MKTRRFIFRKLISGKVKLTPEVLRGLKELGNGEGAAIATPKPGEFVKPKRPEPPTSNTKSRCDSRHLVFVSLLPGRWVRCAGAAVACACLLLASGTFAASGQEAFNAANAAFAQGRFTEAARGFESVLARDGYSAPVLFNLANAQFRDGKTGAAILNYERALALAPNIPDIAANLKFARAKAGVGTGEPSRVSRFTHSLSLNGWATLAAAALLVLSIVLPLRRGLLRVRASLGFIASLAALTLVTASSAMVHRWSDLDRAIVTAKNCAAGIAPVTTAESLFTLSEGEAVILRQERGQFALVQCRDGRSGWVKNTDIGQVLASK